MLSLKAKIRKELGRQTKSLRKKGFLPAVLYGDKVENVSLIVSEKEFEKIFKEAERSSLVLLDIEGQKSKAVQVLIHDFSRNPLTGKFLHVDFYHPSSHKKVTAEVPLVFEGTSPAVKNLGGTLVHEIQQVEVKGLAQNLPREIKVNVKTLKTFDDKIEIKDLKVPKGVEILNEKEEIVANVIAPEKEEKPSLEEKTEKEGKEGEKEEKNEKPESKKEKQKND
ncbi:50S ribosomal protein L25 [bacterium]|nr:50S ribosomal protein L25 [bacterium]